LQSHVVCPQPLNHSLDIAFVLVLVGKQQRLIELLVFKAQLL
jgi:hypothetical protein